jgi:hypothetical protein
MKNYSKKIYLFNILKILKENRKMKKFANKWLVIEIYINKKKIALAYNCVENHKTKIFLIFQKMSSNKGKITISKPW